MSAVCKKYVFFLLCLFLSTVIFGAAPPPPPPPGCWPPPCIPIDGGVSILIAAGALYGAKMSYDKFQSRRSKTDDKGKE